MSTQKPTSVTQLPWYESLRIVLEPYSPVNTLDQADKTFTSAEIIASIEQHHGVPQGPVGKEIHIWILPEDFVRAMRYLGFKEVNTGGLGLAWLMKLRSL